MISTFTKIKRKLEKYDCEKQIKKVLDTPPSSYQKSDDVIIFSMIGKKYLAAYLVAIKSFLYWFNNVNVHILNDGTLDEEDYNILSYHIPGIAISHIADVDVGDMPHGGCWERLIKLLDLLQKSYVIQLDSDIVVTGPMTEISQYIEQKHSFTIGNPRWSETASIQYISDIAKKWNSTHVQTYSEVAMPSLPMFKNTDFKITRGCAGFSGFPKGSVNKETLAKFSIQMEKAIGKEKWSEWGSEQVASNFLISTCSGSHILKWPKYQNFLHPKSNEPIECSCLIHFMGTNRYDKGAYKKTVKNIITSLNNIKKNI
ncbi:hypothetical protein [Vibrio salinus]|uniref:hypothetical protein n=1 Tax=Vibrio salinus TaxID=2899784 RepID=UPI001E2E6B34|nr:hypothetical protein [Vibrio salinus]MCE0493270.1 hypothetical protein [Vibrio salinus]